MQNNKVVITGSNGFLGLNLSRYLIKEGFDVVGIDLTEKNAAADIHYFQCDLLDYEKLRVIAGSLDVDYLINTVALVDMELCEKDKELAYRVNVTTAENVAKVAAEFHVRLLHISTDHIFTGDRSFYDEKETPRPINNYGATKFQAELRCMKECPDCVAVRTNFYGWSGMGHKETSAEWMYNTMNQKKPLTLYDDYYFTPIEVGYLSGALCQVLLSDFKGVLNIAGTERCSKYEFGLAMAKKGNMDPSAIIKAKMKNGPLTVKRQQDLSLSVDRFKSLFQYKLPNICDGIERFLATRPENIQDR